MRDADDDGIGERRRTVTVEYYGVGLAAIDYRFDASDGGGVPGPNAADVVGDLGRGDEATGVVGAVDAGAFAFAKDGIGEDGAFRVLGDDDGFLFRIFNDTVTKSACGVCVVCESTRALYRIRPKGRDGARVAARGRRGETARFPRGSVFLTTART